MNKEISTELCPHMLFLFKTVKTRFEFMCFYEHEPENIVHNLCSLDFYGQSGNMYTTRERFPDDVQKSCPMHYNVDEISEKQDAFLKFMSEKLEKLLYPEVERQASSCSFMRICSTKTGNYHVYCTEGDELAELGRVCSLPMIMFEPPDDADPDWEPRTSEDVKIFCPKGYTAKEIYEKIEELKRKMTSEMRKDAESLSNLKE
jgi:hypothetical protein